MRTLYKKNWKSDREGSIINKNTEANNVIMAAHYKKHGVIALNPLYEFCILYLRRI
jgi:hypothetical protein